VRLINVASFSKIKNQALLLDALKLLRERTNARLTFVGDGETRDNTEKLAREYGFSEDTVSFLGLRRDIPDLLAKSDIFVLCSHYEGVPLSILEAYASGLPVVSTNVGGVPDILTNRENGLLVPPGSAEALADAVSEIMNPALYNKISEENLKKALEFDISRIAEQYITLYERDLR
jgi:glycosyltransferase involved in cell wall biosynthesis